MEFPCINRVLSSFRETAENFIKVLSIKRKKINKKAALLVLGGFAFLFYTMVLSQSATIPQPCFALAHKNVQGADNNDAKCEESGFHFHKYCYMTFVLLAESIIHKNADSSIKFRGFILVYKHKCSFIV